MKGIWASFERKHVTNAFQKEPNLVTLAVNHDDSFKFYSTNSLI